MGKLKEAIWHVIDAARGRDMDDGKIAKRLIEAGLSMMIDEGDLDSSCRIVPNAALDGRFHIERRTEVAPDYPERTAIESLAHAFGEMSVGAGDTFFLRVDDDGNGFSVQAIRDTEPAQEAAQEPQESDSKARSSNGALAHTIAPCRAEIVAYVKSKAAQAAKTDHPHTASVLNALAEELEQHLEERPVEIGIALRDFYADCHARNVKAGWWTDLGTGEAKKRSVGELFMLMVTELWEAYQAYLTQEPDDKLPQYPGLGVELGDLQIRFADFAGALLAGNIVENSEAANPGDAMFNEVGAIAERYEAIRKTDAAVGEPETGDFIPAQDVGEMVVAKLEFNGQRPDHKIENRMKADGKRT